MGMPWLDRERVSDATGAFLSQFDAADPKIALKIRHTYRVAEICERIALAEGFDSEMRDAAWLVGMLHDIGRFVQLQSYGTFIDASSVNHAELGARMLFQEGLIDTFLDRSECDPHVLSAMRVAIALHSAWRLPDDLGASTQDLCAILRDADKVDILRVNCEEPTEVIYPFANDELLNSELSREAKDAFEERSTIPTALKKLPADYALGHCAFGWELEFPSSKKIAMQQGYLRRLFDKPWRNCATLEYFRDAQASMFRWLEKEDGTEQASVPVQSSMQKGRENSPVEKQHSL